MRRALPVAILFFLMLIAGVIGATIRTNHEIGRQLVTDIAVLRARRITLLRPEGAPPPKHANGLACLANVAKAARTAGVGSFNDPTSRFSEIGRGERPLSELSETDVDTLEHMRPWVDAVRECSDAAELQWVEAVEPWSDSSIPLNNWFLSHTMITLRTLLAEGHAAHALQVCTEAIETFLDSSHTGLEGALVAASSVGRLAQPCSEAWSRVTPDVRKDFAPRWGLLSTRLARDSEIFDVARVSFGLARFATLASAESRASYPRALIIEPIPGTRPILMRYWGRWDTQMRTLAAAPDEASFAAADLALHTMPWWKGDEAVADPSFVRFRDRLNRGRATLAVMASIATGTPLPTSATEKDGVITLPRTAQEDPVHFRR